MGAAKRAVMVAATKQHVGKTTSCLAIVQGLLEKYGGTQASSSVGFIKPVGQQHVSVTLSSDLLVANPISLRVDKDVRLFREYFNMSSCDYTDMSPVVIPSGYTKKFLDGKISPESQIKSIKEAFKNIYSTHEFTVVEGTGHVGVGSIVQLDNARVASILGVDMIIIVNGGLGSAFDELALNKLMCDHHGVKVRGVLVNKVKHGKEDMVREYFSKALKQWDIPLLGVVPDAKFLESPSMIDFEQLFKTELLCGKANRLRHFTDKTLVAMGLRRFMERLRTENLSNTLFVTHASRNDIILGYGEYNFIP